MKKPGISASKNRFSSTLLKWHKEANHRKMPWKGEKDPYKIWLSEIILQQTRVDQGLKYYHRLTEAFPGIRQLANAPDEKIFKLWEGLGYYSRCRNLIATARFISNEHAGVFPSDYETILSLKGIGSYTAAAIASFAFNLPHAVLDGNVVRVLSRYFGIAIAVDTAEGNKYFRNLAHELLDKNEPALYNQAIMDFGATICKPVNPLCQECIFKHQCVAFREHRVNELPVKSKKTMIRKRWFYYLVAEHGQQLLIRQRKEKDIWRDLYEFPLIESGKQKEPQSILREAEKLGWLLKKEYEVISLSGPFRQQLSHQLIAGQFIHLRLNRKISSEDAGKWVAKKDIRQFPFSKNITAYLAENSLQPVP
jgi:A/G-specific adenine glycosylase